MYMAAILQDILSYIITLLNVRVVRDRVHLLVLPLIRLSILNLSKFPSTSSLLRSSGKKLADSDVCTCLPSALFVVIDVIGMLS